MLSMRLVAPGAVLSMLSALGASMDSYSTSSPSSTFSPIQVTVLSSNGTDLTSSIPILHSDSPLSTLQQRSSTATLIRECRITSTYTFQSWCERAISPREFSTSCQDPPQESQTTPQQNQRTYFDGGRCSFDEICVGSNVDDKKMPIQAYCISTNHSIPIGQHPPSGDAGSSSVVTAGFHPAVQNGSGSRLAVEAVLTSANEWFSLVATSVVMQAQTYDGLWRTVANGSNYCTGCSSVRLAPFPATAQRVKVDVVMSKNSPWQTGLLWLASYPYPD